jgi:hypothetical protein
MHQRFVRTVQEHNPGMAQADDRSGNLGLGYLYYGVARCYLPKLALCVGSGYGFTFILVARGVQENRNGGRVICVDRGDGPEDSPWGGVGYWNRPIPEILAEFEGRYGLTNIEFRRESVEETFNALEERGERVGMFVHDADHSLPNVEHDFGRFLKVADVEWVALFHDAVSPEPSGVSPFLENLRGAGYQVFVFPQPAGLALVRPG